MANAQERMTSWRIGMVIGMRRRDFLLAATMLTIAMSRASPQQPAKMKRVAMIHPTMKPAEMRIGGDPLRSIIFEEMKRLGYVEGVNLIVERYSLEGHPDRFPEIAREVVATKPDVIFTVGPTADLKLLLSETRTIPIVSFTGDPIASGLASSLARPGGNLTGVVNVAGTEFSAKRLELLVKAVGKLSNVRALMNPAGWDDPANKRLREAAEKMNISLRLEPLQAPVNEAEYRRAFDAMQRDHVDGVMIAADVENYTYRVLLGRLALQYRLPAICWIPDSVEAGALPGQRMQFCQLKRRELLISLIGGATLAWPLGARAQQGERMRRVGALLGADKGDLTLSWVAAFREELRKLGWMEGRNIEIDIRWAKDIELMERYAKELVMFQPEFILTQTTPATAAMLQQTRTIPIIFVLVADPVGSGFVASLPRPGGNATGFTPIVGSLGSKWVGLLKEIAPRVGRIILMFNPPTATFVEGYLGSFKTAAASLGMEAIVAPVHDMHEIESLISASDPNSGLVVIPDVFTGRHFAEITLLAERYRVPAVSWARNFAEVGGLISYGPVLIDEFRRAASYADRILRGEKPADLPVQAPTRYELVVNLKTAKALGIVVPQSILVRADEVIE
jgi:putative ABC transport system substrate-binding protein